MKVARINVEEDYRKKFPEKKKAKFLDYIFDHKLFPRTLYFPAEASIIDDDLRILFGYVCAIHTLPNEGKLLLEKVMKLSLDRNVMIKNQDEIFEEKGEIIMTECGSHSHSQVNEVLSKLYPEKKPYYLAFHGVAIKQKPYHVLIQVGFLRDRKIRIVDTLPKIDNAILKEEKLIAYPLFEDILKRILFKVYYVYLN